MAFLAAMPCRSRGKHLQLGSTASRLRRIPLLRRCGKPSRVCTPTEERQSLLIDAHAVERLRASEGARLMVGRTGTKFTDDVVTSVPSTPEKRVLHYLCTVHCDVNAAESLTRPDHASPPKRRERGTQQREVGKIPISRTNGPGFRGTSAGRC